jgi:hypothetical protein
VGINNKYQQVKFGHFWAQLLLVKEISSQILVLKVILKRDFCMNASDSTPLDNVFD